MTTSDLERRLSAVFHQHAEDAMNHTRTEERLDALLVDAVGAERRRRATWAAAVAAAAAVVALVVWTPGFGSDRSEPVVPAPTPGAEQVAEGFLAAYGDFDRVRAASYLAEAADTDEWRLENRFYQAVGFRLLVDSCEQQGREQVLCAFDFHALGSDELGRGPYSDNAFVFTVRDGKIVALAQRPVAQRLGYMWNGFSAQMWLPFAVWVTWTHPEDGPVMYADWPATTTQALTESSFRLWGQRTTEYVAAGGNHECAPGRHRCVGRPLG